MPYMLAETGAETSTVLDFSDALTTALGNISGDFAKYALIAIPIGLAIWGAPKAIGMVKKFFSALSR